MEFCEMVIRIGPNLNFGFVLSFHFQAIKQTFREVGIYDRT